MSTMPVKSLNMSPSDPNSRQSSAASSGGRGFLADDFESVSSPASKRQSASPSAAAASAKTASTRASESPNLAGSKRSTNQSMVSPRSGSKRVSVNPVPVSSSGRPASFEDLESKRTSANTAPVSSSGRPASSDDLESPRLSGSKRLTSPAPNGSSLRSIPPVDPESATLRTSKRLSANSSVASFGTKHFSAEDSESPILTRSKRPSASATSSIASLGGRRFSEQESGSLTALRRTSRDSLRSSVPSPQSEFQSWKESLKDEEPRESESVTSESLEGSVTKSDSSEASIAAESEAEPCVQVHDWVKIFWSGFRFCMNNAVYNILDLPRMLLNPRIDESIETLAQYFYHSNDTPADETSSEDHSKTPGQRRTKTSGQPAGQRS